MAVSKVDYFGETLLDLSGDTVTPETLAEGATAHAANGDMIIGTMPTTAVLYTEQTLTDEEKAQARENIGIDGGSGDTYSKSEVDALLGALASRFSMIEEMVVPAEAFYLYVDTLGLSVNYTEVVNGEIAGGYYPGSGNPYWAVRVSHNGGVAYSYATQVISGVNRGRCNRVKFSVGVLDSDATIDIGGITHNITWGENIVDISSLTSYVVDVALHTGSAPNEHGVQITAPYFYYE